MLWLEHAYGHNMYISLIMLHYTYNLYMYMHINLIMLHYAYNM